MSLQLAMFRARAGKFPSVYRPKPLNEPPPMPEQAHVPEFQPPVIPISLQYTAPPTRITVDVIRRFVCSSYDVSVIELMSDRRNADIVRPRQIVQYLCTRLTKLSVSDLGRRLNRNHATIMHGRDKIERLRRTDEKFDRHIAMLEAELLAMVAS